MCAHLVPEILRTPEERVLNAGAQRKFQLSADSLSCSVARTLGSCVPQPPNPPFSNYIFYTLLQGHPIMTHCNNFLKSGNKQK